MDESRLELSTRRDIISVVEETLQLLKVKKGEMRLERLTKACHRPINNAWLSCDPPTTLQYDQQDSLAISAPALSRPAWERLGSKTTEEPR